MSIGVDSGPPRLSPAMSSRRLQVLDFIRDYIAQHNEAPSLGEIASGLGIHRSRAHDHVRGLIKQGHLMRRKGMRGLMLPSAIEDAKQRLRDAGYRIDDNFEAHQSANPPTKSRLLPLPPLDYCPNGQQGDGGEARSGRGRAGGG